MGYDLQGSATQALEVLLPLGHGVRVSHRRCACAPAEHTAAGGSVLLRGAHVHVGVVVVLLLQRSQRPLQRLAGVPVPVGAGREGERGPRLGGVAGEAGGVSGGAAGVGEGYAEGDGGEGLDVGGLEAAGVGLQRRHAEGVVGGEVAGGLEQGGSGGREREEENEREEEGTSCHCHGPLYVYPVSCLGKTRLSPQFYRQAERRSTQYSPCGPVKARVSS